ncbi:esterase/lipase [Hyaloraphidium curvatum]|nr:esterase/lipase [Hyaloraphidium curvatum]
MATLVVPPSEAIPATVPLPPKAPAVEALQAAALSARAEGAPNAWELTADQLRAAFDGPTAEVQKGVECAFVEDIEVPALEGGLGKPTGKTVKCRLYRPTTDRNAKLPLVVYFHGSGFVIMSVDTHDGVCRHLANLANCAVLSVEYRLAPENRFPACLEDCLSAVSYAFTSAAALGADPGKIAVAGDSAGGNLAAVVSLHNTQLPGKLSYQVLLYPCVDGRPERMNATEYPSYLRGRSNAGLDENLMKWFWGNYASGNDKARADWRFSPLAAPDAQVKDNAVPAYVMVAGWDPLCDEGIAYARKLKDAGVPVLFESFGGQQHGFIHQFAFFKEDAMASLGSAAKELKKVWGTA